MSGLANLFDLSPRELTNSAFWAWFLDGLRHPAGTVRRRGAEGLLRLLKVPLPEKIHTLQTERVLNDGRRLDVALEGEGEGRKYLLFIENKVRPDSGLAAQIDGYCEMLQNCGHEIFPIFFRSYSGGRALTEKGQWQVREFGFDEMVPLLESLDSGEGTILGEFLAHLRRRQETSRRTRETIRRGGADPEMWMKVAQENQVEELFGDYLALAEQTGCSGIDFNHGRSVAIRYASDPKRAGSPVLSLHLHKSSEAKGLRIGINDVNWVKAFARPYPVAFLPVDFADEPDTKQPNWHFGYFRDVGELQRLFEAFKR